MVLVRGILWRRHWPQVLVFYGGHLLVVVVWSEVFSLVLWKKALDHCTSANRNRTYYTTQQRPWTCHLYSFPLADEGVELFGAVSYRF